MCQDGISTDFVVSIWICCRTLDEDHHCFINNTMADNVDMISGHLRTALISEYPKLNTISEVQMYMLIQGLA